MAHKFVSSPESESAAGIVYSEVNPKVPTAMTCIKLYKDRVEEERPELEDPFPPLPPDAIVWIRVVGLGNAEFINAVGRFYFIDPFTLEDILDTSHRPKYESLSSYAFIVVKEFSDSKNGMDMFVTQISAVVQERLVITFEEIRTSQLDAVQHEVLNSPALFYEHGAGYVAYDILDEVTDGYLYILKTIETDVEKIEDEMTESFSPVNSEKLFNLKKRVNILYRNTKTTAEIAAKLLKPEPEEPVFFKKTLGKFLRDLEDHSVHLNDSIQGIKETINTLYDENVLRIQLQTNKVVNVLTTVSVVLLPYMVIAGIFGMNFAHIPGVSFKYGFVLSVLLMGIISFGLLYLFKRKKFF